MLSSFFAGLIVGGVCGGLWMFVRTEKRFNESYARHPLYREIVSYDGSQRLALEQLLGDPARLQWLRKHTPTQVWTDLKIDPENLYSFRVSIDEHKS